MINKYEKKILNELLDKYENSKSFVGENKVNQNFSAKTASLFPKYTDHSNYDEFKNVNEAIDVLCRENLVKSKRSNANIYDTVTLNTDLLERCYAYINRTSKAIINTKLEEILKKYIDKNEVLSNYCENQIQRIRNNKSVEYFSGDFEEYENTLIAVVELYKLKAEMFIRDFSVKVFKDSKKFEAVKSKIINLLFEYGKFPTKEQVLADLNLISNPTYVNFKGTGIITLSGQKLDLNILSGDIAVSTEGIKDLGSVNITGKRVITVENLTSFHTFKEDGAFIIYLGGYHNKIRRELIKKIYKQNPDKEYYHFGDIDAGGFYILEHLKQKTGVNFIPYKMDIKTLEDNNIYHKKLTENDKVRLKNLLETEHKDVISYMLENDCKLEQEALNVV